MAIKAPSAKVTAARGRRAAGAADRDVRWEWYLKNVVDKVQLTMKARTSLAANFLRDKVVQNISRPVTKGTGPRGGRVVTDRSKPGEFPKAETTLLMKSIFAETRSDGSGGCDGYVGTVLNYGVILELRRSRSFLVRTLNDQTETIKRILTGPMKV